jgi:hypothetical protein
MRYLVILSFLLSALGTGRVAGAQSVTLTPSVIELAGKYQQSTTQTLTMRNGTDLTLRFELEAEDVSVADGKRVFSRAGDLAHSIAAGAVFVPQSIVIPPGESRTVAVTLTVPRETDLRGVVAMFKGTTRIAKGKSASTLSLGALMTFTLSDVYSVACSDLRVAPQTGTANATFEQDFANDGAEPVAPKGVAVILNGAGAIVGKVGFQSQRLLPREQLTFKAQYPGELRAGTYTVLSTFEYAGRAISRTAPLIIE